MANNNNDPNRRGGNGGGDGNGNGQQPKQNIFIFLVAALVTLLCVSFFMSSMGQSSRKEITYNEFVDMIEKGTIESVTIESDEIDITPKVENTTDNPLLASQSTVTYYTGKIEDDDTLTQRLLKYDVTVKGSVSSSSGLILTFLLEYVLPLILFWVLLSFLFRRIGKSGGGIMGVGKSNAKEYVQKDTGITFNDVAGEEEAKESLVEIVDFLHNPQKYAGIGAKLPKGALLVGPPGTGKTLLARAVAGEAHVPFFSLSGSDFIELYVGVGASRVRDLFKEAEKARPASYL